MISSWYVTVPGFSLSYCRDARSHRHDILMTTVAFTVSGYSGPEGSRIRLYLNIALTHWPLWGFNLILRQVIFKLILLTGGWSISCEIVLRWMPLDLTDAKSTLVQVMAWCRQATNHYRSQCRPRSMSQNGFTRPQWVNKRDSYWIQSWVSVGHIMNYMQCTYFYWMGLLWLMRGGGSCLDLIFCLINVPYHTV